MKSLSLTLAAALVAATFATGVAADTAKVTLGPTEMALAGGAGLVTVLVVLSNDGSTSATTGTN